MPSIHFFHIKSLKYGVYSVPHGRYQLGLLNFQVPHSHMSLVILILDGADLEAGRGVQRTGKTYGDKSLQIHLHILVSDLEKCSLTFLGLGFITYKMRMILNEVF